MWGVAWGKETKKSMETRLDLLQNNARKEK
jgi:hypothetical protein